MYEPRHRSIYVAKLHPACTCFWDCEPDMGGWTQGWYFMVRRDPTCVIHRDPIRRPRSV